MQPILSLRFTFFACFLLCAASPNSLSAADFRVRLTSQPQTLNWNSATTGSESAVILNVMEGLFEVQGNQKPSPLLAKKFKWSKDGKTLEIDLKSGIKWADGTPLTAKHFVDSFENLLNPSTNSANASLLFDLESAKDYFLGKIKNFQQVGVKATSPNHLVLKFQEPRINFLSVLTHWATFPIRKDKPTITLGPYQINAMNPITLNINPHYHGRKPSIAKVIFQVISDRNQAIEAYQKNELEYLLQVEDETLAGVGFAEPIRVVGLLHFNPLRIHTNSPEVRRAIMKKIPVSAIVKASPLTRLPAQNLLPMLTQDLSIQKSKINVGKIPNHSLTLGYPNDELSRSVANIIQSSTEQLKIKIEPLPIGSGAAKRYDLILSFFGLDYSEPDQFFSAFFAQGGLDFFDVSSPELVQIIHKARLSQNAEQRQLLYREAANYLQNKLSIVMPLFYRKRAFLLSPKFMHQQGSLGSPQIVKIHPKKS
jgi:oligopeptide transport system substrate-binding protein